MVDEEENNWIGQQRMMNEYKKKHPNPNSRMLTYLKKIKMIPEHYGNLDLSEYDWDIKNIGIETDNPGVSFL